MQSSLDCQQNFTKKFLAAGNTEVTHHEHRPTVRTALFSTKTIYIRIVPKLLTNTWFRAIIISNQSEFTLFDYREVPNHEAVRIRPGEHPAAKFEAAD